MFQRLLTVCEASELCKSVVLTNDLEIVSAISRKNASEDLNEILNLNTNKKIPIFKIIEEALLLYKSI